jgi:hypothetical protein
MSGYYSSPYAHSAPPTTAQQQQPFSLSMIPQGISNIVDSARSFITPSMPPQRTAQSAPMVSPSGRTQAPDLQSAMHMTQEDLNKLLQQLGLMRRPEVPQGTQGTLSYQSPSTYGSNPQSQYPTQATSAYNRMMYYLNSSRTSNDPTQ